MALTVAALADFGFSLRFAAESYRKLASIDGPAENADLFHVLAAERQDDAGELQHAADGKGLAQGNSAINEETAGPMLGIGSEETDSATSAAYRVQRAENTLGRMAAQLHSLSLDGQIRAALGRVRDHVDRRREEVRAARQRARLRYSGGILVRDERVAARSLASKPVEGQQVVVWFGTNRRRDAGGNFPGVRADTSSFGQCRVFVPGNRVMGSLGRGFLGRVVMGDNRVKLQSVEILSEPQFWWSLASDINALDASERQALVFLHGYSTKFKDAARRTAQLKVDLGHKGPAALFSWPSLGYHAGYAGDEAAIEASEPAIQKFLVDFAQLSGASAVHVIAHSMGNRGLLRAMDSIAKSVASVAPVRFGQVFLAAPDVDTQVFQNFAVAYQQLSARTTLYVTKNDKAIGLSRRYHQFARVGLTPPVAIVPGIDTIDASHINLGLIGHEYAAEMRPVLGDIHRLIQGDVAPDKRFGLRRALGGKAAHWEFNQ